MTAAVLASTIPAHAAMGMALISPRSEPALPPLGWQRTVLVVGHDAELAVALRDRLDRAFLTVCEVRPDEAPAAVRASRPWPWMVVGDTDDLAEPFRQALRSLPVLLLWRSPPPRGLPLHLRVVQRFSELACAIDIAMRAEVCGIRLAVGSGLTMPDGTHVSSPVLEARRQPSAPGLRLAPPAPRRIRRPVGAPDAAPSAAGRRWSSALRAGPVMRANAEVLILEDDAETLDELRDHFARKRFHPLATRSAAHAIAALRNNAESTRPVLAVVDWDLSKAADQTLSSGDVLGLLARELSDCLTLVYSANIDSFRVRSEIHRAHPRAWLHDKRDGEQSLIERVDRMLDPTVEDLRIKDGSVVIHLPTMAEHHHREAVRLVVHYPELVTFHSDTATKGVRRFGDWLNRNSSRVAVVSHGNRKYRLGIRQ
jgi:hypothetical protein